MQELFSNQNSKEVTKDINLKQKICGYKHSYYSDTLNFCHMLLFGVSLCYKKRSILFLKIEVIFQITLLFVLYASFGLYFAFSSYVNSVQL